MFTQTKPAVLVFDWGNTLMKELAEFDSLNIPMVDWPLVEAIPGSMKALSTLHSQYRVFVGTNAQQSSAEQVRQALQRVRLDPFVEKVFTFNEIRARKPEVAFYRAIERMTGEFRDQMVMIGDLYDVDITGAKQAGWKAAWYNPQNQPCPGCLPFHDIEVDSMEKLPAALSTSLLPEVETCLLWLQQNKASLNLLQHVQLVAAAAYLLALGLRNAGIEVNPILTHRGGLLHDLAKANHNQGQDHGQAAGELLRARGEPELAAIADHHMLFALLDEQRKPRSWEEKLVYFADKLVEKNEMVLPEERLAGLRERYRIDPSAIDHELLPRIKELESEICSFLKTGPAELLADLKQKMGH